jgi:hypothetical protein
MRRSHFFTSAALAGGIFSSFAQAAPFSYTTPDSLLIESFDALPNTPENVSLGANSWDDDITLAHWHAETSLNAGAEGGTERLRITHGNTLAGAIYSFGATDDFDRALGSIGSTVVGDVYWGTHIRNDTGRTLREFSLTYFGEQWRDGGDAAGSPPQRVDFQYSLNASGLVALAFGNAVNVDGLDFVSPQFGAVAAVALDGNNLANRKLIAATVQPIIWQPNSELWLRWADINHPGNDHALGIDDLFFTASVPEPLVPPLLTLLTLRWLVRRPPR